MPNWVYNMLVVVKGDPAEVLDAIKGENLVFDFNRLIPMPKEVKESNEVVDHWPASLKWALDHWGVKWNACRPQVCTPEEREKAIGDRDRERERERQRLATGWGLEPCAVDDMLRLNPRIPTRQGVQAQPLVAPEVVREALSRVPTLYFDSPWAPPLEIFEALASRFPKHEIAIWSDENMNHLHAEYVLASGKLLGGRVPCDCFTDFDPDEELALVKQCAAEAI